MKVLIAVFFLFIFAFVEVAAAPFVLPKGTEVIKRDESGKTWQMNGSLKMSFEEAKKTLNSAVLKAGFKLKHEIPLKEKEKEHILLAYTKEKQTLIMMLWSEGKKTYFAWGITKE